MARSFGDCALLSDRNGRPWSAGPGELGIADCPMARGQRRPARDELPGAVRGSRDRVRDLAHGSRSRARAGRAVRPPAPPKNRAAACWIASDQDG